MSMQLQTQVKKNFTPVSSFAPALQRKCANDKCTERHKKRLTLQRSSINQAETSEVPPIVHEVLLSPGQPLDTETCNFMEPRFGHDFSKVRVHTDTKAAESAQAVNALAYTVGSIIVFGAGQYAPNSVQGQRMLAHELTHVKQQNRSPSRETALCTPEAPSSLENEASENYKRQTKIDSYHPPEQSPLPPLVSSNNGISVQRKPVGSCGGSCTRFSGIIQPKLMINQPGDKYEEEADRMADKVMLMPEPQPLSRGRYQTQRAYPTYGEKALQRQPMEEELRRQPEEKEEEEEELSGYEEEILQTKGIPGQKSSITHGLESKIYAFRGNGEPLSTSVRAFFEPRFSRDFNQVRVHKDARAAEAAKAVRAKAFTVGKNVVFGSGEYALETMQGKRLLAHELMHIVQQENDDRQIIRRNPDKPKKSRKKIPEKKKEKNQKEEKSQKDRKPTLSLGGVGSYHDSVYSSEEEITYTVKVPAGIDVKKYCLVQWMKGYAKGCKEPVKLGKSYYGEYCHIKLYGEEKECNFSNWTIDSDDKDPIYWSNKKKGSRWTYETKDNEFTATDRPGPANITEPNAIYAAKFKVAVYETAKIPKTTTGTISTEPVTPFKYWDYSVKVSKEGKFSHPKIKE